MGDISSTPFLWPASFNGPIEFPGINLLVNPSKTFFGTNIHWYGIIIALGLVLAIVVCMRLAEKAGITQDTILDVVIYGVPSAIICARLYYVIFKWEDYRNNILDVFKIWEGGIAIYGAIIGAIISTLVYCKVKKIKFFSVADVCTPGLLIGQAVGRWGNFVNREAFGAPASGSVLWRMRLYADNTLKTFVEVHPTFLYESLWNAGVLILALKVLKNKKFDGQVFWFYILMYGLGRLWIEAMRTDSLYLGGIKISQAVALLSAVVGTAMLVVGIKNTKHAQKPL